MDSIRVVLTILIMIYTAPLLSAPVQDSPAAGKRYSSGMYEGRITSEGVVFDRKGLFQGKFTTSKDGSKTKVYDRRGRYIRTIYH